MAGKGTRYSEEQTIRIPKEVESGITVAEQTVYRRRNKYGGLDTSELQRLRGLEAENSRLKQIVAQKALDIDVVKEVDVLPTIIQTVINSAMQIEQQTHGCRAVRTVCRTAGTRKRLKAQDGDPASWQNHL